eukprot:COSAG05_NODE_20087_length_283_cov_0.847826_1_plen_54_part_10
MALIAGPLELLKRGTGDIEESVANWIHRMQAFDLPRWHFIGRLGIVLYRLAKLR